MVHRIAIALIVCLFVQTVVQAQPHRDRKVRDDRKKLSQDNNWYYDDLAAGLDAAKKSGQPLFVVLRCIP